MVAAVSSCDELTLTDGRVLRLEGIERPFADCKEWRDKARQALTELTSGRKLTVEGGSTDRYGRLVAQAYVTDAQGHKIWLQGEMLRRGLAFVYPPSGNEERRDEMRAAENAARHAKAGIWADAAYEDTAADKAWPRYGYYAFVSGAVRDAARVKNMVYLNFGDDWRTDTTIAIATHDLRAFRNVQIDPLEFKGKTIRARGWVKRNSGPMITVTSPAQIEILETH